MKEKEQSKKLLAAAVNRLQRLKLVDCFDSGSMESRPTPHQLEVIKDIDKISHRYVVAGNQSGKSQLGAREVAWLFEDNHPYWNRPKHWGDEPLLMIVVGRTTKQVEENLWRKLKGFINPSQYKVQILGGTIQKVVHTENGNTILFASHHADNEAREKLQAFVAHYVWVDEMPRSANLMTELHQRINAYNGYFLATFTPIVRNDDIRRLVDNAKAPISKKYTFSKLDNPLYEGREETLIEELANVSADERNARLYGTWTKGTDVVYELNSDFMIAKPEGYSPSWRHIESVDPALKSKFGFTLWAEDPRDAKWYCMKAEYISGIYVPRLLVEKVMEKTKGYNLVKRIYDPHEPWYAGTANDMGIKPAYQGVYKKNERKGELITGLRAALGEGRIKIAPWCTDLLDEIGTCRWADGDQVKIINSSTYHLLDSSQYFVDNIPKPDINLEPIAWYDHLRRENGKRRANEEKKRTERGRIRRNRWKQAY